MKPIFVILAAVLAVSAAKSVNLLRASEISDELIGNPRFLIYEVEEGLYGVEDLETSFANITTRASDSDVAFHIFTPENPTRGVKVRSSQLHDIVRKTGFNINRETVVVIHGWKSDHTSAVNNRIKNAIVPWHNFNVIVVDWSSIASQTYVTAQGSVLAVGNFVGEFLIGLNNELNHRLDRVTMIGHSLGAHVAGNAGARCAGLITTIIGLDPAGPLFTASNTRNRLDPTDAQYVHVIHTNDGVLGFGINMGHADYFPNGGKSQPGCGADLAGSCSHSRAYDYYAESINNNQFSSRRCGSFDDFENGLCNSHTLSRMGGLPILRAITGNYFLTTNARQPFARG